MPFAQELVEAAEVAAAVNEFSDRIYQLQMEIGDAEEGAAVPEEKQEAVKSVFDTYCDFLDVTPAQYKEKVRCSQMLLDVECGCAAQLADGSSAPSCRRMVGRWYCPDKATILNYPKSSKEHHPLQSEPSPRDG